MANTNRGIKGMTPSLQFLVDLLSFFQVEAIKIPTKYRERVLAVKNMLNDDPSGLTNTILDFGISSALVNYRIETNNDNLTKVLNDWLDDINSDLRGTIPTGLKALAKEYFRERWKGSSNLLLRTFWEERDGLKLPTSLFFIDGEDIKVSYKTNDGVVRLGDEQYYLRIGRSDDSLTANDDYAEINKKDIKLPSAKNEKIFVQKPFESWGTKEPVPWIIKKGVFRSSMFLQMMISKGEFIVSKALEYLLIIKKGTEGMTLHGQVQYDEEDLKKVSEDLKKVVQDKKSMPGFNSYTTNFDTDISEYIPDYHKAINDAIYSPIEKRILAGLGLVEVVEGVASTRRESILNPKPFVSEISQGIDDFKALLEDIIKVIISENESTHKKWMNAEIKIISSPVRMFVDDKMKAAMRSIYDRGGLSKRTLVEVVGEMDFDLEVQRRKQEAKELDKIMYPPVIQNMEATADESNSDGSPKLQDRQKSTPEAKNFKSAGLEVFSATCGKCNSNFEVDGSTLEEGSVSCINCGEDLDKSQILNVAQISFAQAPYDTNKELPDNIKELSAGAQTIYRKTFNAVLQSTNDENKSRQAAWRNVKLAYKKSGDSWVKKSETEFLESAKTLKTEDLIALKNLEILAKKERLLDKLLGGDVREDI